MNLRSSHKSLVSNVTYHAHTYTVHDDITDHDHTELYIIIILH